MPHQDERPANALARGPAKPEDIERARHDACVAEARHAVVEVEAAAEILRADLDDLTLAQREP